MPFASFVGLSLGLFTLALAKSMNTGLDFMFFRYWRHRKSLPFDSLCSLKLYLLVLL